MDGQTINEKHEAKALMPAVAWPTLVYGVAIAALHWSLVWAGLSGRIDLVWLVIPLGLTTYAHYTLVHESVHKNIVAGYRSLDWVHHAIGWYGSLVLFSSWPLLERTHKNHHSHVNTDKDPDIYVKRSLPSLVVRNILSWMLQIFPIQLLRLVFTDRSLAKGYINAADLMTDSERVQHYATNWTLLALMWGAVFSGFGWQVLALYYGPVFIGLQLLTILFQWLPHHPFEETGRYEATRNTGRTGWNLPFIWQNWHLMHHLWPSVPFYNYERLYRRIKPVLEAKGARHHEGVRPAMGPVKNPVDGPAQASTAPR